MANMMPTAVSHAMLGIAMDPRPHHDDLRTRQQRDAASSIAAHDADGHDRARRVSRATERIAEAHADAIARLGNWPAATEVQEPR
jgi:hypothetical protein